MNDLKFLDKVRIDRWLWAVRICKTRQAAADMCKREKILVDAQRVKPSREVRVGQTVQVKKNGIEWVYNVVQCIDKRVGAPQAALCKEDVTPSARVERLKMVKSGWTPLREKGAGRPTKKERRDLDKFLGE